MQLFGKNRQILESFSINLLLDFMFILLILVIFEKKVLILYKNWQSSLKMA